MIWFAYIATVLALGVLVMMRREIMTGFFRWQDYLLAAPLLYSAAVILFILDAVVGLLDPSWWLVVIPVKAFLGFGIMVVIWGGTLALGSIVLRLLSSPFHTPS